jgi:hypothetical protein
VALRASVSGGNAVTPWLVPQENWVLAIVRQLTSGYGDATQVRAFESETTLAEMISHAIETKTLSLVCARAWTLSIAKAFVADIFINQCVRKMYQYMPANSLPASFGAALLQERPELADCAYQLECRRDVLVKLTSEQPNLLQPYLALLTCVEHGDHTEPVQWVQQQLRELGCTPRVWRAILKSDRRLFSVPLNSFGHPLLALTWVIALIERCETTGPVSPRFIKTLAERAVWAKERRAREQGEKICYPGHTVARQQSRDDGIVIAARPLWWHLQGQFESHATSTGFYPRKSSLQEIANIDQWLSKEGSAARSLVGKKSWAVLLPQADRALRAGYTHLHSHPEWWVPAQPLEQPDSELRVVPLVNAYNLAVQGDLMRNCMREQRIVLTQNMPMFLSVFRTDSEQAIAMVELFCGGGVWHLHQAAGPANREIERVLRKRIVNAAKHIAKQMRRLPSSAGEGDQT